MLEPKKRKYRKDFRGRMKGKAQRGFRLSFGEYGIKAMGCGWLTSRQIEAGRRAITHAIKRGGKVWIRVFPDKPVTARAAGQRMGSGKGDIDRYVCVIKPGRVIFEVAGVSDDVVVGALKRAMAKLPFKARIVKKEESSCMKNKDLIAKRNKKQKNLAGEVLKMKLEMTKLVAERSAGKNINPKKTRKLKKDIAQLSTLIREQELVRAKVK